MIKILFDTGYSDIFIDNANILHIDLADRLLTWCFLTANDHTWGLGHLIQHFNRGNIEAPETKHLI